MRILVLEDEARILVLPLARARSGGLHGRRAPDGRNGLALALDGVVGSPRPRPAAARPERPRGARGRCARATRAAGADPLRPHRICRRSCWASSSARGLHAQAVLARRAARPRPRAAAPGGALATTATSPGRRLALDLARRQARIGDRSCDLSDREFRLLHHLAAPRGRGDQPRAAARRCLGLRLRSAARTSSRSAFGACGKKLGPDAPIETVRNAGYRLAARRSPSRSPGPRSRPRTTPP